MVGFRVRKRRPHTMKCHRDNLRGVGIPDRRDKQQMRELPWLISKETRDFIYQFVFSCSCIIDSKFLCCKFGKWIAWRTTMITVSPTTASSYTRAALVVTVQRLSCAGPFGSWPETLIGRSKSWTIKAIRRSYRTLISVWIEVSSSLGDKSADGTECL